MAHTDITVPTAKAHPHRACLLLRQRLGRVHVRRIRKEKWWLQRDSNPCFGLERPGTRSDLVSGPAAGSDGRGHTPDRASTNARAASFGSRAASIALRTATPWAPAPRTDPMRSGVRPPIA
jgi:hypothetical protein